MGALLLSAGLLTGCGEGENRHAGARTDDRFCKAFEPSSSAMATGIEGGAALDDCLHRWGYTLAKSEDDAAVVADAVVAACSAPLARWNQQALAGLAASGSGAPEAPSLLTGEPTTPIAEHNNFAQSRAIFYVVQARAGDCDPPLVNAEPRQRPAEAARPKAMTSPDP